MTLAGISLLVLEDDRDTREMFATQLVRQGAHVRTAASAELALQLLESWSPDAILCDLHLPGVDGYGFLERVRELKHLDDVPLIAISASHPGVEHQKALDAGFAIHLTKPSKLSEITGAVSKLVAAH